MENLQYAIAEKHARSFQDSVMHDHHEAMECLDCDKMLLTGILAFRWAIDAERSAREADLQGVFDLTPDAETGIYKLLFGIRETLQAAEHRIKSVISNGYALENLEEFREAQSLAEERLELYVRLTPGRKRLFQEMAKDEAGRDSQS